MGRAIDALRKALAVLGIALRVALLIAELGALAVLLLVYPRLRLFLWGLELRLRILGLPPRVRSMVLRRYGAASSRFRSSIRRVLGLWAALPRKGFVVE